MSAFPISGEVCDRDEVLSLIWDKHSRGLLPRDGAPKLSLSTLSNFSHSMFGDLGLHGLHERAMRARIHHQ
jgi:hypothetical protein